MSRRWRGVSGLSGRCRGSGWGGTGPLCWGIPIGALMCLSGGPPGRHRCEGGAGAAEDPVPGQQGSGVSEDTAGNLEDDTVFRQHRRGAQKEPEEPLVGVMAVDGAGDDLDFPVGQKGIPGEEVRDLVGLGQVEDVLRARVGGERECAVVLDAVAHGGMRLLSSAGIGGLFTGGFGDVPSTSAFPARGLHLEPPRLRDRVWRRRDERKWWVRRPD